MLAEARVGNHDRTLELADQLAENQPEDAEVHLERARALAQLSRVTDSEDRKAVLTDQAIAALLRSVENGYSDPFRISVEPDLKPLRETEGFRQLVTQLEAAADSQ